MSFLLSSSIHQAKQAFQETGWTTDLSYDKTRKFVGRSFAGTHGQPAAPTFAWRMQYLQTEDNKEFNEELTDDEKVNFVTYGMSCFVAQVLQMGGVVLARTATNNESDSQRDNAVSSANSTNDDSILALAIICECDIAKERSSSSNWWSKVQQKLLNKWTVARLMFHDGRPQFFDHVHYEIFEKVAQDMDNQWHEAHYRIMNTVKRHWYVTIVATDPRYQKCGHGTALMTRLMQQADQFSMDCYLEAASDKNVKFYEKFGFVCQDCVWMDNLFEKDGKRLATYCMVRRHQHPQQSTREQEKEHAVNL